jgi:hypothetical protein
MKPQLAVGVVVLVLAGAGVMLAQSDPMVGTWKLNPAKSKYTSGSAPKAETLSVAQAGDQYQVTITGTAPDGTPISVKYTVPVKGGAGKVQAGFYDAVSGKKINDNTLELSEMKSGKEMLHVRVVVSKDGKTQRATVKGTDPQGKPVAGVGVLEKQ